MSEDPKSQLSAKPRAGWKKPWLGGASSASRRSDTPPPLTSWEKPRARFISLGGRSAGLRSGSNGPLFRPGHAGHGLRRAVNQPHVRTLFPPRFGTATPLHCRPRSGLPPRSTSPLNECVGRHGKIFKNSPSDFVSLNLSNHDCPYPFHDDYLAVLGRDLRPSSDDQAPLHI